MSFYSAYKQGFVRVAACTPSCEVADPAYNVGETLKLAREGAADNVALMVFPELGLSGYAIDRSPSSCRLPCSTASTGTSVSSSVRPATCRRCSWSVRRCAGRVVSTTAQWRFIGAASWG